MVRIHLNSSLAYSKAITRVVVIIIENIIVSLSEQDAQLYYSLVFTI